MFEANIELSVRFCEPLEDLSDRRPIVGQLVALNQPTQQHLELQPSEPLAYAAPWAVAEGKVGERVNLILLRTSNKLVLENACKFHFYNQLQPVS